MGVHTRRGSADMSMPLFQVAKNIQKVAEDRNISQVVICSEQESVHMHKVRLENSLRIG